MIRRFEARQIGRIVRADMSRAERFFLYGQSSFFGLIALSILLRPDSLTVNHGLSFFGVEPATILPYAFALLLCGWFVFRTAQVLSSEPGVSQAAAIWLMALLPPLLGILLTPYSINPTFGDLHELFGTILFLLQLVLVGWLLVVAQRDWLAYLLMAGQIIGGVVALLSLNNSLMFEIQGQLVFQFGFTLSVARFLRLKSQRI